MPKTNKMFWGEKFRKNVLRDKKTKKALSALGWKSLVVWECQAKELLKISKKIEVFLGSNPV